MKIQTMQPKFLLLAAALVALIPGAQAQTDGRLIPGFSNPESVIRHGAKLYVSNIGKALEPDKKDGDGFISQVDYATGKIERLHFLPATGTLDAPKGSAFIGDVLYVADIDRIVGFHIKTRKTVFELTVSGSKFLNDVVAAGNKLYVSATDKGLIYEVDVQQKTATPLAIDPVPGANGLSYDPATGKLYCVGFSKDNQTPNGGVYEIDLTQKAVAQLPGYEGFLDGAALADGKLYFSDWKGFEKKGILEVMDLKTHTFDQVAFDELIAGPADFTLSADKQYFIIPVMLESSVLVKKRK